MHLSVCWLVRGTDRTAGMVVFISISAFYWSRLLFNTLFSTFLEGEKIKKPCRCVQIPKAIQNHGISMSKVEVSSPAVEALGIPSQPWGEDLPRKHQQNPLKWIFHSFLLLAVEITKSYSPVCCVEKRPGAFSFPWFAQRIFLPRIEGLEFMEPQNLLKSVRNPRAPGSRMALLC